MEDLISVVMSTYNEPIDVLDKSVNSILSQTYKNIEFIIVNDNPSRKDLGNYLEKISNQNTCVRYIKNDTNLGLVNSLNTALSNAKGKYVARMDADDVSDSKRLENQLRYLIDNELDVVGSSVFLINENDEKIGYISVPTSFDKILKYYDYGSGLLHPTWFLKKSVYDLLDGYRDIPACEDFDFMLRAFYEGFKAGNVSEKLLNYRVRKDGISVTLEAKQKLITYFLQQNRYRIQSVTLDMIKDYSVSNEFKKNLKLMNSYIQIKNTFKNLGKISILEFLHLTLNKYFYINIIKKYKRNRIV